MNVLIFTPYYLPGFKAGGPTRSLANLVEELGREINFHVITGDRDLGDAKPYADVGKSSWQSVGNAQVAYLSRRKRMPHDVAQRIHDADADVIYINAIFDPHFCALPLFLLQCRLVAQRPTIIAPRGVFSPAALAMKQWKKRPYLNALRLALPRNLIWHATSELEKQDILRTIGHRSRVFVAPNLCAAFHRTPIGRPQKQSGQLNLAFFSRISPKKNLLAAIRVVQQLSKPVTLDIWGPLEDTSYWRHCQAEAARLPQMAKIAYRGSLPPNVVAATLAHYDVMLLPTLGENYCHAIVESLTAGCPVIISDRTPWRNLQMSSAGWDLPLEDESAFVKALNDLIDMGDVEHQQLRDGARAYFEAAVDYGRDVQLNRSLFEIAATERRVTAMGRQRSAA